MLPDAQPPLQSKTQTDTLWLEQYLFWLLLICVIISAFEVVAWLNYRYTADLFGIIVPGMIAVAIWFARQLVRRQHVQSAMIFINIIFFGIAIWAALTTGGHVVQAIFVPLTSLILALPFLNARYMLPIVIAAWISTAVTVVASLVVAPTMALPSWTPTVTAVIGLIVLATLMRLLWLHHSHLLELLAMQNQTALQLQESRDNLELQVAARTRELEDGRELYSSLIRNIPRGSVMLFDHDLRFLLAEGPAIRAFPHHAQTIVGKTIEDIYPPALCTTLAPKYRAALGGEHIQYELSYEQRVYDVQIVPIHDGTGAVASGLFMSQDITDRYMAEQALRESEDRYRQLIEFSPDAVFVHQQRKFVYLNPVAVRLIGATLAEELLGHDVLEVVDEGSMAMIENRIDRIISHQQATAQGTWTLRQLDGTLVPVESVGIHVVLNGIPSVLAMVRDISTRKQAEDEQRALERKLQETQRLESLGVLAGGIAHDFNNLLMGMMGNTSLALTDLQSGSSARESMLRVEQAALRAAELVRQMLAYAGQGQFVIGPINLNQLLDEMMRLLRASIPRTVALECHCGGLVLIEGDVAQLRQVVMNLLLNASEAIGEQPGAITITTSMVSAHAEPLAQLLPKGREYASRYIQLMVADTGCGMDSQTLARMFDPFFSTKFAGRGLGLAAVQGIIRSHHGVLEVTSTPAVGSTFKIWLPVLHGEASSDLVAAPAAVTLEAVPVGSGVILVIDDEEQVRTVVSRIITHLGYTALLAEDGACGIELFEAHADTISCVLLDLAMPKLGGVQVFHAIRQIRPSVRVLLMSGYSEQEIASTIIGLDENDILSKPFSLDVLRNRLRHLLEDA